VHVYPLIIFMLCSICSARGLQNAKFYNPCKKCNKSIQNGLRGHGERCPCAWCRRSLATTAMASSNGMHGEHPLIQELTSLRNAVAHYQVCSSSNTIHFKLVKSSNSMFSTKPTLPVSNFSDSRSTHQPPSRVCMP